MWEKIVKEIKECKKCRLHKYRKNPVPGEGALNAKIMFIGEAPGAVSYTHLTLPTTERV